MLAYGGDGGGGGYGGGGGDGAGGRERRGVGCAAGGGERRVREERRGRGREGERERERGARKPQETIIKIKLNPITKSMDSVEVKTEAGGDDSLTQENLTLAGHHHLLVSSHLSKVASKTHIRSSRKGRAVKRSWPQGFPDVKSSSMVRAENFQSNLGSEFPSFIKALRRSHVNGCCSMGLPTWFCDSHLPKENTTIVFEDENKRCYDIYYLAHKPGLSGGWRRFTMEHNLQEGDVLVCHLIRPTKFKVYIITPHDKAEADGAVGLPNLEDRPKQANAEDHAKLGMTTCTSKKRKPGKLLSPEAERKNKRTGLLHLLLHKGTLELSENQSEKCDSDPSESRSVSEEVHPVSSDYSSEKADSESDIASEKVDSEPADNAREKVGSGRPVNLSDKIGLEFGVTVDRFKDVHGFRNFEVSLNELLMQSELADHTRNKYYELCCSQSALLHKHILKGIDAKLIAAIISETVNVADALRACKLSTPPDELSTWYKTVIAFELLGMDVGFLRVRAEQLLNLITRSEVAKERKRTLEDKIAQVSGGSQIRELEAKLIELKEVETKLTELKEAGRQQRESLEALNMEAESYEQDFFDVVSAPW